MNHNGRRFEIIYAAIPPAGPGDDYYPNFTSKEDADDLSRIHLTSNAEELPERLDIFPSFRPSTAKRHSDKAMEQVVAKISTMFPEALALAGPGMEVPLPPSGNSERGVRCTVSAAARAQRLEIIVYPFVGYFRRNAADPTLERTTAFVIDALRGRWNDNPAAIACATRSVWRELRL